MGKAAIYLRATTLDHTIAHQERVLREVAARVGREIVRVYQDHSVNGAKGRGSRPPEFDALRQDATNRQFDLIMVWSVDRLGRSINDLVDFFSEVYALKIDLYVHEQGLDTTTPSGKVQFQMMGVFVEFERTMMPERIRAGVAQARAYGKKLGRPKVDNSTESKIRNALRASDMGLRKIAAKFGVAVGTVQRIKRELPV